MATRVRSCCIWCPWILDTAMPWCPNAPVELSSEQYIHINSILWSDFQYNFNFIRHAYTLFLLFCPKTIDFLWTQACLLADDELTSLYQLKAREVLLGYIAWHNYGFRTGLNSKWCSFFGCFPHSSMVSGRLGYKTETISLNQLTLSRPGFDEMSDTSKTVL